MLTVNNHVRLAWCPQHCTLTSPPMAQLHRDWAANSVTSSVPMHILNIDEVWLLGFLKLLTSINRRANIFFLTSSHILPSPVDPTDLEVNDDGLKWPRGKDVNISILMFLINRLFQEPFWGLLKNWSESTEFSCTLPTPRFPLLFTCCISVDTFYNWGTNINTLWKSTVNIGVHALCCTVLWVSNM